MASLLDREHYEGNVADVIRELRSRIEALERTALSGVAGPEGPEGPQGPTGATGSPGPGAPSPLTQGDVLVVDSTPEITTLPIGSAHEILKVNAAGTDPAWEPFDWNELSGVGGADMAHDHTGDAGDGGTLDIISEGGGKVEVVNGAIHIKLGDAAGVKQIIIYDSGDTPVAVIDSDGEVATAGQIQTGTTTTGGAASTISEDLRCEKRVMVNETANGDQTIGVTINQGANDDEILALKSSNVGHGGYQTEIDTFGLAKKYEGGKGGLLIDGYKESGGIAGAALILRGYLDEDVDTTKTTAGRALVEFNGFQTSGGSRANTVADGNVLGVRTQRGGAARTVFLVDEDGDVYYDGSVSAYDTYDDALMCQDLAHVMSGEYEKLIGHNRAAFEAAGIIGPADEHGRFMVSVKQLNALVLGAVGQLYRRLQLAERQLSLLPEQT